MSKVSTTRRAPVRTTERKSKSKGKTKAGEKTFVIEIGPPHLTRFERARIIGTRSLQISLGAPPFVKIPPNVYDPIVVAMMELRDGVLPISIRRSLPDGRSVNIPISHFKE
ncbi:MAG: DNA-directed RNA polymerase subunit K [Nitrososphaerales archaeon]|nr:DNA-directed RNA polymerase subunit K [Nitrososphaerota archaeon]